ncbi:hypothetical protein Q7P37_008216 [Cladosporium fusiforme]
MTSAASARESPFYKKIYFGASPTWDVWNKLTAAHVFALTELSGFEGQNVYFHGNHPIRYVYLCGMIQQIDLAPGAGASRFALLSLDDGSGSAIEVKITRRQDFFQEGEVFPSNTMVDNLDVTATWGLASLLVDKKPIHVGSILKVKGTITSFRQRQIDLKRVFVVKDTNEEAAFWAGVAEHRRKVLSRPWVLTDADMKAIDQSLEDGERRERERKKEKKAKIAKFEERKARSDEKREKQRKRVAEVLDAGALDGSNVIKAPWE